VRGRRSRFSRRKNVDITADIFDDNKECGPKLSKKKVSQALISYPKGFVRRYRYSSRILAANLIDMHYNRGANSVYFRWKRKLTEGVASQCSEEPSVLNEVEALLDTVNKRTGEWFTVYSPEMITICNEIYQLCDDQILMNKWANIIGTYFVREMETVYHSEVSIFDLIGEWGSDIFHIDLKQVGYAMRKIDPMNIDRYSMGRILDGEINVDDPWMCGLRGSNITVRQGSYELVNGCVPGCVSFSSDLEHMLVMWSIGNYRETVEAADSVVNLDNYVICQHHMGDNHYILHRRMFVKVLFEGMKRTGYQRFDNVIPRSHVELTICGLELAKEVCAILRKLTTNKRYEIALTPNVPLVTNWNEFEKEVRNTHYGRTVNKIYLTFLKYGSITNDQSSLITKWKMWGRAHRGSDDYGIHCMMVTQGHKFLDGWDQHMEHYNDNEVHPCFNAMRMEVVKKRISREAELLGEQEDKRLNEIEQTVKFNLYSGQVVLHRRSAEW
jgi:hypothetical protein